MLEPLLSLPPPLPGVAKWPSELRDLPLRGSGASRGERDASSVAEGGVRARLGTRCAYECTTSVCVCVCARVRFSSISDSFFVTLRAHYTWLRHCGVFPAYAFAEHTLARHADCLVAGVMAGASGISWCTEKDLTLSRPCTSSSFMRGCSE
jgi:hypothetical protein